MVHIFPQKRRRRRLRQPFWMLLLLRLHARPHPFCSRGV